MVRNSHWLTVKKNTLELLCRSFLQFAGSLHFVLRVLLCFLSFSLFVCFLFFLWCNACCFYSFSAYPFLELGFSLLTLNAISTELHAWAALLSVLTLSLSLSLPLALPKRVSSGGSVKVARRGVCRITARLSVTSMAMAAFGPVQQSNYSMRRQHRLGQSCRNGASASTTAADCDADDAQHLSRQAFTARRSP